MEREKNGVKRQSNYDKIQTLRAIVKKEIKVPEEKK